jgi:diguanylate cyclase (GGDEF)-like protein
MTLHLVSALAGDHPMTQSESSLVRAYSEARGRLFYSDLLYTVSHHYFAPEVAEGLWNQILSHKCQLSELLGREVRIAVATLDYLSNITSVLRTPTLISETYVSEIASLSMRDGMTGLFNHSSCYEVLELEYRNHRRYGIGVSLLLLDIDDFKLVNDRNGHQAGDGVLVALAKVLTEETRDSDICCRFGGEEFVVILPFINDPDEACEIAERIRVRASSITCGVQAISISVGVALCDRSVASARALVDMADRALYEAKRGGKNRVVLAA